MNLDGTATLSGSPEQVWAVLTDPAVLARTIPGCLSLDQVGEDRPVADRSVGSEPLYAVPDVAFAEPFVSDSDDETVMDSVAVAESPSAFVTVTVAVVYPKPGFAMAVVRTPAGAIVAVAEAGVAVGL